MSRTRIKICGVMRPEDAAAAARAGADAVGMVFYPKAKRCVSIERAREIVAALPAFVTPVGLFVDQGVDEVRETARATGLRYVQLHGAETPQTVASLHDFMVIKAVRAGERLAEDLAAWRSATPGLPNLRAIVLETASSAGPGGTGEENDWERIAALQRAGAFAGLPPIIAAGGLRVENVAAVVRRLHPHAVDVSSGVEEEFGQKSATRIEAFVREVAAGDRGECPG